ncbi:hypothetical protein Plhal304r1_c051g0133841 [Plasmopara halstedii]
MFKLARVSDKVAVHLIDGGTYTSRHHAGRFCIEGEASFKLVTVSVRRFMLTMHRKQSLYSRALSVLNSLMGKLIRIIESLTWIIANFTSLALQGLMNVMSAAFTTRKRHSQKRQSTIESIKMGDVGSIQTSSARTYETVEDLVADVKMDDVERQHTHSQ